MGSFIYGLLFASALLLLVAVLLIRARHLSQRRHRQAQTQIYYSPSVQYYPENRSRIFGPPSITQDESGNVTVRREIHDFKALMELEPRIGENGGIVDKDGNPIQ